MVALVLSCLFVSLNVGCDTGVDDKATPSGEDVTKDETDPDKDKTGDVAPPAPPAPGEGSDADDDDDGDGDGDK